MPYSLTKSDYMLYLKHPAWLWLKVHDKTKLPPVSASTQAIFDAGHDFESYAESLFPGGVKLDSNDYKQYLSLPARTQYALSSGAGTIFQGRFEADGLTFICDVVTLRDHKVVDLCEIKSGTKVKDDHLYDLAFQMVVLERCGYTVGKIMVAHVNSDYVRQGDIQSSKLVMVEDVSVGVKALRDETMRNIDSALSVINADTHPDLSPRYSAPGALKDWISIYKTMVDVGSDSIYDLCRLTPDLVGELEDRGILRMRDIDSSVSLKKYQSRQVDAVKSGLVHIEPDMIQAIVGEYQYPLYFFDYETFSTAVPEFDGLSPYDKIPFQYSLHVQETKGGELKHLEYLHADSSNPVQAICQSLQDNIGPTGSIVTWYATFEKSCNSRLAQLAPEYQQFLHGLNSRVVDLMDPFMAGFYVHKDFMGRSSIKSVLPVLVPELSYKQLTIQEGNSASRIWLDAIMYGKEGYDKEQVLADLRKYCHLDTLAMVKIYEVLS